MPITNGLEITIRRGEGGEPRVSVSYRPRVTGRIVEAQKQILPLAVRHHPVAAILTAGSPSESLNEFAQIIFEGGRRFERIELEKLARKARSGRR